MSPSRAAALGCSRPTKAAAPTANLIHASSGEAGSTAGLFRFARQFLSSTQPWNDRASICLRDGARCYSRSLQTLESAWSSLRSSVLARVHSPNANR